MALTSLQKFVRDLKNKCRCICFIQCCISQDNGDYERLFPDAGIYDSTTTTTEPSTLSSSETSSQHTSTADPNTVPHRKEMPYDSSQSLLSHI